MVGYLGRGVAKYFTSAKLTGYFGDGCSGDGWSDNQFFGEFVVEVCAGGF